MTYYYHKINGNIYSTAELKGEKMTLLKHEVIFPITDAQGKNYLIMVNPIDKTYKVIKRESKSYDYFSVIQSLKEQGYIIVKDFDITEPIKM